MCCNAQDLALRAATKTLSSSSKDKAQVSCKHNVRVNLMFKMTDSQSKMKGSQTRDENR